MSKLITFFLLLLLTTNMGFGENLLIKDIAVFDGVSDSVTEPVHVYLIEGRIGAISAKINPNWRYSRTIDGGGDLTLMPGLVDLHTHLGIAGSYYFDFIQIDPIDNALTQIWSGVTTIVDLHTPPDLIDYINRSRGGEVLPNLFFAGPLFTSSGGHGTQFSGAVTRSIDKDEDLEIQWSKHLELEPRVTKLVLEDATWLKFPGQRETNVLTFSTRISSCQLGLPQTETISGTSNHSLMKVDSGALMQDFAFEAESPYEVGFIEIDIIFVTHLIFYIAIIPRVRELIFQNY